LKVLQAYEGKELLSSRRLRFAGIWPRLLRLRSRAIRAVVEKINAAEANVPQLAVTPRTGSRAAKFACWMQACRSSRPMDSRRSPSTGGEHSLILSDTRTWLAFMSYYNVNRRFEYVSRDTRFPRMMYEDSFDVGRGFMKHAETPK
jgi:hypothetical protein